MFTLTDMEQEALLISVKVAAIAVLVVTPMAFGAAYVLARRNFIGKAVLDGIIHIPLVAPPVVVGYLLLLLLGVHGPVGALLDRWFGVTLAFTWQGAAIAAGIMAFPLILRPIRQAFEQIDERLELAARTLGAGKIKTFITITAPLAAPGVVAGVVTGFARALGEFGATITFVSNIPGETATLPIALYSVANAPGGDGAAFRLMMISFSVAIIALALSEFLARKVNHVVKG
jgi:molybdate transport system permease protein